MENRRLIRLVCLLTTAIPGMWAATAVAEPKSYPLTCRGGGDMRFTFFTDSDADTRFRVYFRKAARSASEQPVAPGHCAWLDRPLDANEPDNLWFKFNNVVPAPTVDASGRVASFDYKMFYPAVGGRESTRRNLPLMKYLVDSILQAQVFQVRGYAKSDANGRYILVTHTGP